MKSGDAWRVATTLKPPFAQAGSGSSGDGVRGDAAQGLNATWGRGYNHRIGADSRFRWELTNLCLFMQSLPLPETGKKQYQTNLKISCYLRSSCRSFRMVS